MQAFAVVQPLTLRSGHAVHAPPRMSEAAPKKKRSAAKRLKRVVKSRARLLEHVPCVGDFPTATEIDAAVAALEAEVLEEKAAKDDEVAVNVRNCIEVCTGKACARNGAAVIFERAKAHGDRGGADVVESRCLKCCNEPGTTVRTRLCISREPVAVLTSAYLG
jgi:hypothetical protein